jgi:hypothetical protein
MAPKLIFGCADVHIIEPKNLLHPANESRTQFPPQPKANVVSQNGGDDADQNHPIQLQRSYFVGKEAGEHESGLAGNRETGILSQQPG